MRAEELSHLLNRGKVTHRRIRVPIHGQVLQCDQLKERWLISVTHGLEPRKEGRKEGSVVGGTLKTSLVSSLTKVGAQNSSVVSA